MNKFVITNMTAEVKDCVHQSINRNGDTICNYLGALTAGDKRYAYAVAQTINPNRQVMLCNPGTLGEACRDGMAGAAYRLARSGVVSSPDQIIPVTSIFPFQRSE